VAESKRLQILKALTTHLEGVDGYDLANKVWRGRSRPADESVAPFIILFEMPPEAENQADERVASMPWYIGIQGYIGIDNVHPTDPAHDFMAAVKARVGQLLDDGGASRPPADYMLGGLVENLQVDGGMCFDGDETINCCFFALKLTLTVVENLGDPYAEA